MRKVLSEGHIYLGIMFEAKRLLLLLGLFASIVLSSMAPLAQGQTLSGRLVITTDRELYGLGNLKGGGHITWTFSEEQAAHLRAKIAGLFSGYSQMPPGYVCEGVPTQSNFDQVIDSQEALTYTERLENLMEESCSDSASGSASALASSSSSSCALPRAKATRSQASASSLSESPQEIA